MNVARPPAWWRAQHRRTVRERRFVGDTKGHTRLRTRVAEPGPGQWRYVKPGTIPRA